jgi:hypothetical protein
LDSKLGAEGMVDDDGRENGGAYNPCFDDFDLSEFRPLDIPYETLSGYEI